MAEPSSRDAEPRAATSSPLATREPFATPISFGFQKTVRILKAAEFRRVYKQGTRFTGKYFAAFCLRVTRATAVASEASATQGTSVAREASPACGTPAAMPSGGPRLGFTVPRAFGKAVLRNRAKRRLREILRVRLPELAPEWDIVINPRRSAIAAPVEELQREVDRLVTQCRKH